MLLLQLHVGRTHAWRLSDQGEGSELAVATSMEGKGKERVASCSDSRGDRQSEKEESCSDLSMCSLCFAFGARTQTQAGGRVASRRNCLFTTTPTSAAVGCWCVETKRGGDRGQGSQTGRRLQLLLLHALLCLAVPVLSSSAAVSVAACHPPTQKHDHSSGGAGVE